MVPSSELVIRVKTLAREGIASGDFRCGRVARELGRSERALRRDLHASRTSYRAIVDAVRRELALRYLAEGSPGAEVSSQLGFSEPSTFYRAFKRWTGQTIREYRQACQIAGGRG